MKFTVVFFLTAVSFPVFAQVPAQWCDKNEYSVLRFYKHDTIHVSCDTIYVVNTSTYKLYADVYRNFNAKNSDMKKLVMFFDHSTLLYENRIRQQDREYLALKNQFDDLVKQSHAVVNETSNKLQTVENSLSRMDKNVSDAQASIEDAKKLIRQEIRLGNRQRLKWGAGGVVLGVCVTSILFAIVD